MGASRMQGDNKFKVDFNSDTDQARERKFLDSGEFEFGDKTYVVEKKLSQTVLPDSGSVLNQYEVIAKIKS